MIEYNIPSSPLHIVVLVIIFSYTLYSIFRDVRNYFPSNPEETVPTEKPFTQDLYIQKILIRPHDDSLIINLTSVNQCGLDVELEEGVATVKQLYNNEGTAYVVTGYYDHPSSVELIWQKRT